MSSALATTRFVSRNEFIVLLPLLATAILDLPRYKCGTAARKDCEDRHSVKGRVPHGR